MDKNILKARAERLKKLMTEKGMDVLVAISPENVLYSTGAYIITQRSLRDRLEISIIPREGDAAFVVCGIEESLARDESWIGDIRPYVEFKQSPVKFLADVLVEKGLDKKNVGIELHYLSSTFYKELTDYLPDTRFYECRGIFDDIRMIKEPQEIELLAKAAKLTRKAVDAAFLTARPGDTERHLSTEIMTNLMNLGMDWSFMVLGTGERTRLTHPTPAYIPMKPGDIIRVDFGGILSGYQSDLARTAVIGKPSSVQANTFKKLAYIQREVIENMKLGVKFCDIYNKCKALFEKNDLPFTMPHIGHGLGVDLHEHPIVNPLNETVLQENMIVNIEPLVIYGGYAYHIEDLVWITPKGPVILTESEMSDEIPVIS
ncbi:MAG: Xaa-Pro peptidase family protein [Clostridiaceae bacterium]|nr:Xaa-Pro peptidase family protein [Clostridiaceae bacterium]